VAAAWRLDESAARRRETGVRAKPSGSPRPELQGFRKAFYFGVAFRIVFVAISVHNTLWLSNASPFDE